FDSARQSQIEASRSERGSPSRRGKGDEEDQFGKAAASQNGNLQLDAGINQFLTHSTPILDVRSPSEFLKGHIPGAVSFPLFSDAERSQIGLIYRQQGKDAAVKSGLHFVGPKLASFIDLAVSLSQQGSFRLYCWRGGMRSSSVAWLLKTAGFE